MPIPLPFLDGGSQPGMGLSALDLKDWLWLDEHHASEMAERAALIAGRLAEVHAMLPGAEEAARELQGLVVAHLLAHHPGRFEARGIALDDPLPLRAAGQLVQEDLCLMQPQANGEYALTAAILCFPAHWRLLEKIGRPMSAIHAPVPGFGARLERPAARFFSALGVERPVWRANWSVVETPRLFHPGPRGQSPELSARNAGQKLWLRVERQTLRRLPETGAIAFTIRTMVEPLAQAVAEPGTARRLAARVRGLDPELALYKGLPDIQGPLLAWLDARAKDAAAVGA